MITSKDINFTKISTISAFGCSYTYGTGLQNPNQDSWVPILGRLLKIPNTYNFGIPGNNNQTIYMQIVNYIEQYKILMPNFDPTKVFIIVMPSYNFRKFYPFYINNTDKMSYIHMYNTNYMRQKFSIFQSPLNLKRISLKHITTSIISINNFYSLTIFNDHLCNARYIKLLINYLNLSKCSYAIIPSNLDSFSFQSSIEGYINFIKVRNYPTEPEECGAHPLEEGNKAYAEYLYEKLKEIEGR